MPHYDRTTTLTDVAGNPLNVYNPSAVVCWCQNFTGAQTDTLIGADIPTGSRVIVTQFSVKTANANTADVSARLGFGTANCPAYGNNGLLGTHPGIASGSGFAGGSGAGSIGEGADDEEIRFTCGAPTGGSVDVNVTYFIVPS